MDTSKVTIITGGGRGIGAEIALRMAKETALLLVGRTQGDLEATCDKICKHGGIADYILGDVSVAEAAAAALDKVHKQGWRLQNLVCNAGIGGSGHTHIFPDDFWKRMFAVNVDGAWHFIRACLPEMLEQKSGSICLISSSLGVNPYKYQTAYSATKAALIAMAKSLSQEYGKDNIYSYVLCPGFVESQMTRKVVDGLVKYRGMTPEQAEEKVRNDNPQRRIIAAEEIAEIVAFVCSGAAPALAGDPILLTGGK